MTINSQWATIEGGITNTFPLSINRTAYWTALRRGECYYQDMTSRNRRGILSFESAPNASSNCFVKTFVETPEQVANTNNQLYSFFAYGRWWRASETRLVYSPLGLATPSGFAGFISFADDSSDPIKMLATDGDGRIFILKRTCGYMLDNANQDPSVWRKSAPEYSIGSVNDGTVFSNAILNGSIATVWDGGGEHGNRHFTWSGRGAGVELSEDIRGLTESDTITQFATINWSQQLILIGSVCYDINAKRIFYYSGASTASYTSRPFYDSMYRVQTINRLAFIIDGKDGTFDAEIEYGQSADNLQKTKAFKVSVKGSTKNRFRHIWTLDLPIICRVWRVSIKNLQGCSISQIDADVSVNKNPDFEDQA